jgi:hypothetical protein
MEDAEKQNLAKFSAFGEENALDRAGVYGLWNFVGRGETRDGVSTGREEGA